MVDEFTPEHWLKRAKSNYILGSTYNVDNLPEEIFLEDLCFEFQQCAEKSIKAVLVYNGVEFPWTHNINELLNSVLDNTTIEIPAEVKKATQLTKYAVRSRYPHWNIITKEEFIKAQNIAETVYNWAKQIIEMKS
ncbi:MAG: hypothetical protein A2Y25_03645 [Candidatus Melainabacteria bacterium GWF2_37_15]|nr:MAG: hypothetical protein A2Y25_03645 [Candidatus Melainabacteria bacterium GWF2_37_15]